MMRICKNQVTDIVRDKFGANPLRVPEARIQPMCILEIEDQQKQYLGEFRYLVKNGFDHPVPVAETPVAEISDTWTKTVDIKTGFTILGGFLKALNIDPAGVSAAFKRSKNIAFSFSNVRRKYVDVLQLGQILSHNDLFGDTENFILQPALAGGEVKLGLITDVIVSNNFSITSLVNEETTLDVDIEAIGKVLGKVNAGIEITRTDDNAVKFQGPYDLTFAFSCLEIKIDPNTGKFSRGDWMTNLKSASGTPRTFESLQPGEERQLDRLMLDDNKQHQLLIEL
jgi:hypothetical protein